MKQRTLSLSPGDFIIKKNRFMYYIKEGLQRRIFMKINIVFNTHVILALFFRKY